MRAWNTTWNSRSPSSSRDVRRCRRARSHRRLRRLPRSCTGDRRERLRAIPFAAALGIAQAGHDARGGGRAGFGHLRMIIYIMLNEERSTMRPHWPIRREHDGDQRRRCQPTRAPSSAPCFADQPMRPQARQRQHQRSRQRDQIETQSHGRSQLRAPSRRSRPSTSPALRRTASHNPCSCRDASAPCACAPAALRRARAPCQMRMRRMRLAAQAIGHEQVDAVEQLDHLVGNLTEVRRVTD